MQEFENNNKQILIKTLGEIIKSRRESKGKTIYRISAEASMSKSTWREVELGVCNDINFTTLWKISEGLEDSLSDILQELAFKLGNNFTLIDID